MLKTTLKIGVLTAAAMGILASSATAQGRGTPEQQRACGPDVSRYCRPVMAQSDLVILSCLQQNRPRISRACDALLRAHGQ